MKKFSIKDNMLNNISGLAEKNNNLEAKESFKIDYVKIEEIIPNEKNFYDVKDIDDLAEDIKVNGLNHNLVVKKDNENYKIISGERRYTALKSLAETDKKFSLVPVKIIDVNEVDEEIILIQANAKSRELTEKEKLLQVKRLTELYKKKKENGEKVQGRVVELVGEDLGLSKTQVGRYTGINNSLIEPLKKLIENEKLSISNASEFASLSQDSQEVILEIIEKNISLNRKETLELKNKLKQIEQEKEKEKKELEVKLDGKIDEKGQEIQKLEAEKKQLETKLNQASNKEDSVQLIELEKIKKEKERLELELKQSKEKKEEYEKNYERQIEILKSNLENQKKINTDQIKDKNELEKVKQNTVLITKVTEISNRINPLKLQISKMLEKGIEIEGTTKEELSRLNKIIKDLNIFLETKSS